jgi:DNA-directed RNA polymerase specialized sigma24 family protein
MNTRNNDVPGCIEEPEHSSLASRRDIDSLAQEIFARLHDENFNDMTQDPQRYLTQAANTLVHLSGPMPEAVRATLQGFSPNQREMLFMHLRGLTCAQIAQQHGSSDRAVLKDLARSYAQLRFQLNPTGEKSSDT